MEINNILRIADINGVNAFINDDKLLLRKYINEPKCKNRPYRYINFNYNDAHTFNSLCFAKENIALASKTTTKFKSLLNSTKDKSNNNEKPGIYKATCSKCDGVYIGQT